MTRKSSEEELAAAKAVAARVGLGVVKPEILKLAKHTTVRLAPLPIVARIQSTGPVDRSYETGWRELTVARHLAAREAPSVSPTSDVDPGPHVENDCVITLWEFAVGRAAETEADALKAARALTRIHDALADLPDLPPFTVAVDSCQGILANFTESPKLAGSDRLFLQRLYADLRQELSGRDLVLRPLHGDAHLANVLITPSGAVWMDLEAVCVGPLEWDVVTLPCHTSPEFAGLDHDLMRLLKGLRSLCVTTWCWADFDRSSDVADAAIHHLDMLKARFR